MAGYRWYIACGNGGAGDNQERADMWALNMALRNLMGPATCTDNVGVVQALRQGKELCIVANQSCGLVDDCLGRRKTQKLAMNDKQIHVVEGNGKADAWAEKGTELDGAEFAEVLAPDERQIYAVMENAAQFNARVEQWDDMGQVTPKEESKLSFVMKMKEGDRHRAEPCRGSNE